MYVPTIRSQMMEINQQILGEGAGSFPLKSAETHGSRNPVVTHDD
jgi:hypothetical protein